MKALVIIVLVVGPGCGDDIIDIEVPPDAADLPVCPALGCTVPVCHEQHCFCNGMACVPTGIPVPMEAGAL